MRKGPVQGLWMIKCQLESLTLYSPWLIYFDPRECCGPQTIIAIEFQRNVQGGCPKEATSLMWTIDLDQMAVDRERKMPSERRHTKLLKR